MSDTHSTSSDDEQTGGAPSNIGALLREHREKAGLDVADVARVLRISQKYLEALEDGRSEDLPGTPYAIGFVRSYADHLHLDGEEIVRRYKDEVEGLGGKTDLIFPKPIPDGGVPGTAVLALGVIVAAVAYGAWYWQSSQESVDMARVEPVPEHMAAESAPTGQSDAAPVMDNPTADANVPQTVEPAPEPAEPMAETAEEIVEKTADAVKVEETVETTGQDAMATMTDATAETSEPAAQAGETVATTMAEAETVVRDADEATEAVTAEPSPKLEVRDAVNDEEQVTQEAADAEDAVEAAAMPQAEPAVSPADDAGEDGDSRVRVRAISDSWIQVRDAAADRLLFSRLLRTGDFYDVPNRGDLRLMTGNAGALELVVDGEVVPPIGDMGELRRDVSLDPEKLKNGSAVSN